MHYTKGADWRQKRIEVLEPCKLHYSKASNSNAGLKYLYYTPQFRFCQELSSLDLRFWKGIQWSNFKGSDPESHTNPKEKDNKGNDQYCFRTPQITLPIGPDLYRALVIQLYTAMPILSRPVFVKKSLRTEIEEARKIIPERQIKNTQKVAGIVVVLPALLQ